LKHRITRHANSTPATHFHFTRLELYAAMARAVVRTHMTKDEAWHETRSMFYKLDRHVQMVVDYQWNKNLNLYYKDVDKTYLPGRLGDALGLLEMERKGYPFFAHIEDVLPRRKEPRPDYIFFRHGLSEATLLECKGSFRLQPGGFRKTVQKLHKDVSDGMKRQVKPWLGRSINVGHIPPVVLQSGYGVGALVTDSSNHLVTKQMVSTRTRGTASSINLDPIAIHYARWLRIMSIPTLPEALLGSRGARKRLIKTTLPFLRTVVDGRRFLVHRGRKDRFGSWGLQSSRGRTGFVFGLDEDVFMALYRSALKQNIAPTDWLEFLQFESDPGDDGQDRPVQLVVDPDLYASIQSLVNDSATILEESDQQEVAILRDGAVVIAAGRQDAESSEAISFINGLEEPVEPEVQ
jgi:hypothetical protein